MRIFALSRIDMESWDEIKRKYSHTEPPDLLKSRNIRQIKDIQFDESKLAISAAFEEGLHFSYSGLIEEAEVSALKLGFTQAYLGDSLLYTDMDLSKHKLSISMSLQNSYWKGSGKAPF